METRSPSELFQFISGRADQKTKQRLAAELHDPDSRVRRVINGLKVASENCLNVDWGALAEDMLSDDQTDQDLVRAERGPET